KPGKDLLQANVVVSAPGPGWFTVDLSDYHLQLPPGGAFVAMEWVNSGDSYFFEQELPTSGKEPDRPVMVKHRFYGQVLGSVSKKGGIMMWGTNLGHDWIPYGFEYKGEHMNAMIRASIDYEVE
ncbi:MAG: hypothetical protein LWW85_08030, partial [Marinilabiliales bacterium]|nr:hypothetical protein [Marinilabiliales bacterium]